MHRTSGMDTTPKTRKRFAIGLSIFALGVLVASALLGRFGFASVCTQCGAIRNTTEWQIPWTHVILFRTSSEHQTPVSAELLRSGAVAKHEHQWLFSSGGGNGVACAIGDGRYVRPVVESDSVAAILDASQRFGEVQFRDRLVRLMFDPKTSEAVRQLGMSAPTNGFSDASTFRVWLTQEIELFDKTVAMDQKR